MIYYNNKKIIKAYYGTKECADLTYSELIECYNALAAAQDTPMAYDSNTNLNTFMSFVNITTTTGKSFKLSPIYTCNQTSATSGPPFRMISVQSSISPDFTCVKYNDYLELAKGSAAHTGKTDSKHVPYFNVFFFIFKPERVTGNVSLTKFNTNTNTIYNNSNFMSFLDSSNPNNPEENTLYNQIYVTGTNLANKNIFQMGVYNTSDKTLSGLTNIPVNKTNLDNVYSNKVEITNNYNYLRCIDSQETFDNITVNLPTNNIINLSQCFKEITAKTIDLSNFDTSNVTNMSQMFMFCFFDNIIWGDKFNTSNVTNMADMFWNSSLTKLDLTPFDMTNVTTYSTMFSCINLANIVCSTSTKDFLLTHDVNLNDTMKNGTIGAVGSGCNWELTDYTES